MHFKIYSILLLFCLNVCIISQEIEYAKEIVNTLASEKYKGRGYALQGINLAADYITEQYTKIGLIPFGDNYGQSFQIEVNTFPGKMELKIDNTRLLPGEEYIIDPYSGSINGSFKTSYINKNDLSNIELLQKITTSKNKKVLIIDEHGFDPKNIKSEKNINELLNVIKYNPQINTAATVIFTDKKLTWGKANIQASKSTFIVNKNIDPNKIKTISMSVDAKLESFTTKNLVGYIKGTSVPDSFLVLTAHYDHLGTMGSETYFPGANDNGSGIAMLLTLAKYFKENPPYYSIAFIALTSEEMGLLGAKYYTEHPIFDLNKIKFLVNFDLAGTGEEGIQVVNGSIYNDQFNRLQKINQEKQYLEKVKIRGEACNSDHCMFYQQGVPCFYIYTLGGIKAYHDIYDRAETLPLTEFNDYSKLMIEFLETFNYF